jgi:hypothetical protein
VRWKRIDLKVLKRKPWGKPTGLVRWQKKRQRIQLSSALWSNLHFIKATHSFTTSLAMGKDSAIALGDFDERHIIQY